MKFELFLSVTQTRVLAKFLFSKPEFVNHALSIGQVAFEMKAERNDAVILIGFVDNDKRIPPYFRDFEEIERGERVLFKQKDDHRVQHFLVVLDKAIETFLLHNAAQVDIKVTDFGFSEIQKEFQKRASKANRSKTMRSTMRSLKRTPYHRTSPSDFVKIDTLLSQFL